MHYWDPQAIKGAGVVDMRLTGVFFLIIFSSILSFATPSAIFLLRHAEKPLNGSELSEMGWERAKVLPKLFSKVSFAKYGPPACLIGMNKRKVDGSIRALQTLKYVSEYYKLQIIDTFNKDQDQEMIQFVMTARECDGQLAVIVWEHNGLEKIASELGVDPVPKWPGNVFDRVWVIDWKNGQAEMQDLPQRLLKGDSDQ